MDSDDTSKTRFERLEIWSDKVLKIAEMWSVIVLIVVIWIFGSAQEFDEVQAGVTFVSAPISVHSAV